MSENISIEQNGVATIISVDKLRTPTEQSGNTNWVPEEDMGVAQLHVWQNGTYEAEDFDVFGFDSVWVDVNRHGGDGASIEEPVHVGDPIQHDTSIKEGGKSRIMGGAKRLKVNKQGGGTMTLVDMDGATGTLSATRNAVYKASNDRKYAYTSVTVDVPDSGGGGGDDPYSPENLPKYIAGSPLQISYVDGEEIVLGNGDVKAYKEVYSHEGRNTLWTSPEYPNGGISANEIDILNKTAIYHDDGRQTYPEYVYSGTVVVESVGSIIAAIYDALNCLPGVYTGKGIDALINAVTRYDGKYPATVSVTTSSGQYAGRNPISVKVFTDISVGRSINLETLYNCIQFLTFGTRSSEGAPMNIAYNGYEESTGRIFKGRTGMGNSLSTLNAIAHDYTQQYISYQWKRPVDYQTLSGGFYILVYPAGTDLGYGGEVVGEGGTQQ